MTHKPGIFWTVVSEAPVHVFDQWNFFSADLFPQDLPFRVVCSSCPKEQWGLMGLKAEGLSAKLSSTSISHDLGWQVRDDKDPRAWRWTTFKTKDTMANACEFIVNLSTAEFWKTWSKPRAWNEESRAQGSYWKSKWPQYLTSSLAALQRCSECWPIISNGLLKRDCRNWWKETPFRSIMQYSNHWLRKS